MLRYAWRDTKAALMALAQSTPLSDPVQVTYVNPETGEDAENILGFFALMLRPGQTLNLPARSPAQVFHQIEGNVTLWASELQLHLSEADTCAIPGYTAVVLQNISKETPAFVFIADESPLHRKLGVYETRV
jgi:gentisate 1,2-dioxygenase